MLEIAAPITALDGLRALQLVESCYASLESGAVTPF